MQKLTHVDSIKMDLTFDTRFRIITLIRISMRQSRPLGDEVMRIVSKLIADIKQNPEETALFTVGSVR